MSFTNYNNAIFDAFCLQSKQKDIISRKQKIIEQVFEYYNYVPRSLLFLGFNPAILSIATQEIYVTEISDQIAQWIQQQGIKILKYNPVKKVDCVIAFDEYLTFAHSEEDQKSLISSYCSKANALAITTVKDYKNQDFKEREYSQPAIIKSESNLTAFSEIHDWDYNDKNSYQTNLYKLQGVNSYCYGQFSRRTLYFKQLAKFSIDAGAGSFLVHKNIMAKSLIKKNYEHVISVSFK